MPHQISIAAMHSLSVRFKLGIHSFPSLKATLTLIWLSTVKSNYPIATYSSLAAKANHLQRYWVELSSSSEKGIYIYECSSKHTRWNSWEKMLLSALHVNLDRCFDYGWVDDHSFNTFTFSLSYLIHFFLSIYFLYILFLSILFLSIFFLSIFFLSILFLSILFLSIFLSIYLSFYLPLRRVNRRVFYRFPYRCLSTFPFYQFLSRSISI